ncbi:MAG TPA: cupredoxin domain-containing protein [Xanthobacteraceae bacterium]
MQRCTRIGAGSAVELRLGLSALLLAAALCCADAQTPDRSSRDADWTKAESVVVTMVNYEFIPDRLSFRRGVAYRLHLENRGSEIHDFSAPEFFKAIELNNPEVLGAYATRIVVRPQETKDMYFVATRAGSYELTCADHDWAGMTARITVE